ncbi:RNA polymerase sigma factor [Dysgonomonadaceae bacterium zrk40]|nr:RNA polymerase sigma factor [Dysgonomonadaceae bacterium zrk40]
MNENQRVQQVLSGTTSAFAYFVETYQDLAITIAYRICGNMQDAEDVVQESYVKAYRNLHTFRSESKFSTWLYRIVYNTAVTHSKTRIWTGLNETEIEHATYLTDHGADARLAERERREVVTDVLERMPKGDALLLTLYYMEDHPVKEIASITGLNEPNVKVKLFRARKMFKELMTATYSTEEIGYR